MRSPVLSGPLYFGGSMETSTPGPGSVILKPKPPRSSAAPAAAGMRVEGSTSLRSPASNLVMRIQ